MTTQKIWFELAKKYKLTIFDGYEKNSVKSKIISILQNFNEVDFLKDQSIEDCILLLKIHAFTASQVAK